MLIKYLYIDFPLLGTEKFTFPFIINCRDFNETEYRDVIFLNSDEKILILIKIQF